jgi:hypothetical protein
MNNKRLVPLLIIILGIIILIAGAIWFFRPFVQKQTTPPPPPPVGTTVPPGVPGTPQTSQPQKTAVNVSLPDQTEQQAENALRHQANAFASRAGTYGNGDGFESLRALFLEVTPDLRTFLEKMQQDLATAHPMNGPTWGQTSRVVATKLTKGLPVKTSTEVEAIVQVQQTIEEQNTPPAVSYKEAIVTFVKQNGAWVPRFISWRNFGT